MYLARSMSVLALCLLFAAVVHASSKPEAEFRTEFVAWTQKHHKVYENEVFLTRYNIFKANYDAVHAHNSKTSGFKMGLNEFSAHTWEEFSLTHLGYKSPHPARAHKACTSSQIQCGTGCCPNSPQYACSDGQCFSCPGGSSVCGDGCCSTSDGYVCTTSGQCISCGDDFTTCPNGQCCPSSYTCDATGCAGAQIATGGVLTPTVNWTATGFVTSVKNQGQCGSCWSYSTAGALEAAYNKKHNLSGANAVSLSEQNLIDCSGQQYGTNGCDGGTVSGALQYVKANGGIDSESSYPLTSNETGAAGTCAYRTPNSGVTVTGYGTIRAGNETALQAQVDIQPVSVAIDAVDSLQGYVSGVFDDPACGKGASAALNHAVLIVGYGTDPVAGPYWIVKNSWGPSWGLNGYFLLQKGKDTCGVSQQAVYPIVS